MAFDFRTGEAVRNADLTPSAKPSYEWGDIPPLSMNGISSHD